MPEPPPPCSPYTPASSPSPLKTSRSKATSSRSSGASRHASSNPFSRNERVSAMHIDRKLADAVYRSHFGAFVCVAFESLNPSQRLVPNWHIDAVCYSIQQMVTGQSQKRLGLK